MSSRLRPPVESIMRGVSSFTVGTTAGREPVAITMRSKPRLSSEPSVFVTRNVVEFSNPARPCTYLTLRCFDNTPRPPVSFLTTLSFQERKRARSILGAANSIPQSLA